MRGSALAWGRSCVRFGDGASAGRCTKSDLERRASLDAIYRRLMSTVFIRRCFGTQIANIVGSGLIINRFPHARWDDATPNADARGSNTQFATATHLPASAMSKVTTTPLLVSTQAAPPARRTPLRASRQVSVTLPAQVTPLLAPVMAPVTPSWVKVLPVAL